MLTSTVVCNHMRCFQSHSVGILSALTLTMQYCLLSCYFDHFNLVSSKSELFGCLSNTMAHFANYFLVSMLHMAGILSNQKSAGSNNILISNIARASIHTKYWLIRSKMVQSTLQSDKKQPSTIIMHLHCKQLHTCIGSR